MVAEALELSLEIMVADGVAVDALAATLAATGVGLIGPAVVISTVVDDNILWMVV